MPVAGHRAPEATAAVHRGRLLFSARHMGRHAGVPAGPDHENMMANANVMRCGTYAFIRNFVIVDMDQPATIPDIFMLLS
jgi:hypothetical protein